MENPINWGNVQQVARTQGTSKDAIVAALTNEVNRVGVDKIMVSHVLRAPENLRGLAYSVYDGWQGNFRADGVSLHKGRPYKLRVLSASATWEEVDGFRRYRKHGAVKPGDWCRHKIGWIEVNPDTGKKMTGRDRSEWDAMGREYNIYADYKVDADGCISVPFEHAYIMLRDHGKKFVSPEFVKTKPDEKDCHGQPVGYRTICNWWYEEMPPAEQTVPAPVEVRRR